MASSKKKSERHLNIKRQRMRALFSNVRISVKHLYKGRVDFIQMKLPLEKITPEFEQTIRKKAEKNAFQIDIRKATQNDIEHIKNIHEQAWRSFEMRFRPISDTLFDKIFKDPNIIFLVATLGNSIECGFILLDIEGEKNDIGIIAGLGILPEYQNKGIGTALGLAAYDFFKERGVKELRCEVHEKNKISYSFIKQLGFEEAHGTYLSLK